MTIELIPDRIPDEFIAEGSPGKMPKEIDEKNTGEINGGFFEEIQVGISEGMSNGTSEKYLKKVQEGVPREDQFPEN